MYAIGECALWDNKIFGLVAPGYSMAKIAQAISFPMAKMRAALRVPI
ncbi:hypothetical protein OK016_21025 [Vibrio chagasii]|nr:hypothetical protein [Vibrio chagasii]